MGRVARALSSFAAYLFDMDGTLTLQDRAIEGAAETLSALKASGKHVVAVTNNSSLGQHALAERFRRIGLPLDDHEVFSALVATARLVAHEPPAECLYVGDNPEADVAGAHAAGMAAMLVLTGVATTAEGHPEYVLPSVAHLAQEFRTQTSEIS
jgi:ribonucleotide monophosphatase NagD (HAD superfamily)